MLNKYFTQGTISLSFFSWDSSRGKEARELDIGGMGRALSTAQSLGLRMILEFRVCRATKSLSGPAQMMETLLCHLFLEWDRVTGLQ